VVLEAGCGCPGTAGACLKPEANRTSGIGKPELGLSDRGAGNKYVAAICQPTVGKHTVAQAHTAFPAGGPSCSRSFIAALQITSIMRAMRGSPLCGILRAQIHLEADAQS
jgi:hypothetical protein